MGVALLMRLKHKQTAGVLFAILSVMLFSSFTLASRLGLSSALQWWDLAAVRFGIGGVLMAPMLLRHGVANVGWRDGALLALFGGLGFALVAYAGFSLAPAAHGAVLLHGTLPLSTFAILRTTSPRAALAYRPVGLCTIAVGVLLMALDSIASASPRQLLGDGLLLLASGFWSAYGVLARRLALPPTQSAALVAVASMCCFLPIYALIPNKALFSLGAHELLVQALVQGVLIGAVSIFVYTRAVATLGPATTALFTAAVPCITTLLAVPLLSETPSPAAVCGVGAVTLGMGLALRRKS